MERNGRKNNTEFIKQTFRNIYLYTQYKVYPPAADLETYAAKIMKEREKQLKIITLSIEIIKRTTLLHKFCCISLCLSAKVYHRAQKWNYKTSFIIIELYNILEWTQPGIRNERVYYLKQKDPTESILSAFNK